MNPLRLPPGSLDVRTDGDGQVVLEASGPDGRIVVISGYDGPPLPPALSGGSLEQDGQGAWTLRSGAQRFDFTARGMECLEPRPGLFDPLLASFALEPRDRRRVGLLLKLLRLPGGEWLLRWWHARRR